MDTARIGNIAADVGIGIRNKLFMVRKSFTTIMLRNTQKYALLVLASSLEGNKRRNETMFFPEIIKKIENFLKLSLEKKSYN